MAHSNNTTLHQDLHHHHPRRASSSLINMSEIPSSSSRPWYIAILQELYASLDTLFSTHNSNNKLMTWLMLCGPLAILGDVFQIGEAVCFSLAGLALIPCAERLSFVTEQVAMHTNGTIGALLNATFGNAPELLIAVAALRSGYYRVVQLAMLGSMLTNLILVFGVACFIGGCRWQVQTLRITSGNVNVGMLFLACAGFLFPAILILSGQMGVASSGSGSSSHAVVATTASTTSTFTSSNATREPAEAEEEDYSRIPSAVEITFCRVNAVVLMVLYLCFLIFQLGTHKDEYDEQVQAGGEAPSNVAVETPGGTIGARDHHQHQPLQQVQRHVVRKAQRNLFCLTQFRSISQIVKRTTIRSSSSSSATVTTTSPTSHITATRALGTYGLVPSPSGVGVKKKRKSGKNSNNNIGDGQEHDHHDVSESALDVDVEHGGSITSLEMRDMKQLRSRNSSISESSRPIVEPHLPFVDPTRRKSKESDNGDNVDDNHNDDNDDDDDSTDNDVDLLGALDPVHISNDDSIDSDNFDSFIHLDDEEPLLSMRVGVLWLFIITLCVSALSDILVDTIDGFAQRLHLSQVFTSMVIVPFFSNVAEQVSAFIFAYRDEMDLVVGVTVGSAVQIATFVLPGSVLIGYFMDRSMTLFFHAYETTCLVFGVICVAAILQGGTTNWLVGAVLVGIYIIMATGIWFHELEDLTVDGEVAIRNHTHYHHS
jgi:Ca2+/H+ antiporter